MLRADVPTAATDDKVGIGLRLNGQLIVSVRPCLRATLPRNVGTIDAAATLARWLSVTYRNPQVQEVVAGAPAHACGVIEVGDQLLSINGDSVEGKKPSDISHLIVGPAVCISGHATSWLPRSQNPDHAPGALGMPVVGANRRPVACTQPFQALVPRALTRFPRGSPETTGLGDRNQHPKKQGRGQGAHQASPWHAGAGR